MKRILLYLFIILKCCQPALAQDKKISQLPNLPSVTGNEYLPLALSGSNYYVTPNQLKSWMNITGYVPLAGNSPSSLITGNLFFSISALTSRYLTSKAGTNDSSYIKFSSSGGKSSIFIQSVSSNGISSNVNASNGHQSGFNSVGIDNITSFVQDTSSHIITSSYTGYKGFRYSASTCNFVNANRDSSSHLHQGAILRLITAATSTLTTSTTLTGDVTGTGTGTISTTSTNSITINGNTQALHGNPSFTVSSGTTTDTLKTGYGLSGTYFNGSANQTWKADTTSLASKLYVDAKTASFITNTVTTLSGLSSVGTLTAATWNAGLIAGQFGGTGVANTGKTITLGGSIITTGTATPSLAFPSTSYTYTYPPVSTTILGKTGNIAANRLAFMNDANQIATSPNLFFQTFDVVNNGRGIYINDSSLQHFSLGNYPSLAIQIINHPQFVNGAKFSWRFQNASDIMALTYNSGSSSYYLGLGASTGLYVGNNAIVPTAKIQIGSTYATGASSTGNLFSVLGATLSDAATAGTAAMYVTNAIGTNTMTASNARTYTDLANFYIAGVNTPSTNVTATRNMALWVGSGFSRFDGTMAVGQNSATYQLDVAGGDIGIATVGKGLRVAQGTNGMVGTVALSSGTATVSISGLTTNDIAVGNYTSVSGSSGSLQYACTSGTLTITSITSGATTTNTLDNSTVSYFIIRKY